MEPMPGQNCRCGDDDRHGPNHCDDCGTRLVWWSVDGGAEIRACPDCH